MGGGGRQREYLYMASLDKSRTVSHPYGFLSANPTWSRFSRWGEGSGGGGEGVRGWFP